MLTEVYLKDNPHDDLIYIDTSNFDFDIEKVYNKDFEKILVDSRLYDRIRVSIQGNIMFGYPTDNEEFKIGNVIRTPDFLLEQTFF